MNPFSEQRVALAHRRLQRHAGDQRLLAALITGSVADDHADDNSDVDFLLTWSEPIAEHEFQAICDAAVASGGGVYGGTPEEGFAVYEYIDGIRIDVGYDPKSENEKIINGLLSGESTDLSHQLIASGILKAIPVFGDSLIGEWKRRLLQYPEALREKMIVTYLRFTVRWVIEKMMAERGEPLWFYERVMADVNNMTAVLCALNRVYHPGKWKGMVESMAKLPIQPPNFMPRVLSLFKLPLPNASTELESLVADVYGLVEQHMPHIDMRASKERYQMVLRRDRQK
jgi:hypothetical protein